MKFADIKQFTSSGNNIESVRLYRIPFIIEEYKNDMNLQLNPEFQRGHVWNEKQQSDFMEFTLQGGKTGRDIYFNHPGWLHGFYGDFVCVDGLQRLTAIIKFLNNELKVFGNYLSEYEDNIRSIDCNFIFHINNLQSEKEVLRWYVEMNRGGVPHTEEEINRVLKMIKDKN